MRRFGGPDSKTMLRHVLKGLCVDEVYQRFSWKNPTAGKSAFIMMKAVNDAIFKTVQKAFEKFTEHEYSKIVQEFLKHAKFRIKAKT